ncbi:MAG: hypothetical protein JO352_03435 [Chloroflexi bacterium]|nr:hypothetical protein [Chloroflexota bacterium]
MHLYILGTLGIVAFGVYRSTTGRLPTYVPPPSAAGLLAQPTEAVAFVSARLGVVADPDEVETVLSQVTRTLVGQGALYIVLQGLALLMLMLAADTGFADFPRLLAMLGNDGYVPSAFSARGVRLSFSNGIVLIAAVSAVLILVFQGSVAGLVPLFTVGAFSHLHVFAARHGASLVAQARQRLALAHDDQRGRCAQSAAAGPLAHRDIGGRRLLAAGAREPRSSSARAGGPIPTGWRCTPSRTRSRCSAARATEGGRASRRGARHRRPKGSRSVADQLERNTSRHSAGGPGVAVS